MAAPLAVGATIKQLKSAIAGRQSREQVQVGMITADTVDVVGAGTIVETGFGALAGTTCTIMVFSADSAGFAEMRVSCT